MTETEKKTVESLLKAIQDLKGENAKFREDVKMQIDAINAKIEKKHVPITLEQSILNISQNAIGESIQKALTAYGSPLSKLVEVVVHENTAFLKQLVSESFDTVIKADTFKESIITAFSHKVAKTIISNNDGMFDKVANELKGDAIFKSKMMLAVSSVVEECLTSKKS